MVTGFKERMLGELRHAAQQDASLKGLALDFTYLQTSIPPNYLGWLGGSVLGSLEKFSLDNSISSSEWKQTRINCP